MMSCRNDRGAGVSPGTWTILTLPGVAGYKKVDSGRVALLELNEPVWPCHAHLGMRYSRKYLPERRVSET